MDVIFDGYLGYPIELGQWFRRGRIRSTQEGRGTMTGTIPEIDTAPKFGRRQIVKGAAWSAPTIAAAAFPAAAAASTPAWDFAVTGKCSTGLLGILGKAALSFTIAAA